MRNRFALVLLAAIAILSSGCSKYTTVKGDPLEAKIYTLKNGLKVYMTVNKDEPRIQTYIAVRVGGKNDPADNTGLAHYLEHMMFKGTEQFGTSDYAAEKPMLQQIDSLFEVYRTKTDPAEREALYHEIDSISYEASKIAIPNEYDKLMSMIGAEGTNAYTSNDVTCYVDEIPSNQVENWVKIAADRFRNCVFRGFHTELEAVYEEKNMGMTNDGRKAIEKMDSLLFLRHPYGTQTVIGTQDHLKNPSLKAIRYQKDTYYVPNNMAICLSGDFDPDKMVALIEKYFGDWEPNKNLPKYNVIKEDPITTPRVKDVYGFESEFLLLAWRTPGAADKESEIADIAGEILNNGMAGLIDLDVMQRQKVLGAFVMPYERTDYGAFIMEGFAKQGQDLEEVKTILLEEIAKLRTGEFSDSLLTSVKNNVKLSQMRALERNSSRADMFVDSFINGTSWKDEVASMKNVDKITKAEVVAWAQKYLGPESYIAVYKRTGEDKTVKKIDAPKITPIVTNRDKQSGFLAEIAATEVEPIEPVFVDYQKDLEVRDYKGLELLYKENVKNDIASVSFRYDIGTDDLPLLGVASDYISYLGTPTRTADDIAKDMYALACNFIVSVGANNTTIGVSGLSENIGSALAIVQDLIMNATPDEAKLAELKSDIFRSRQDSKMNQRSCSSALQSYVFYGPEFIKKRTLTNEQVAAMTSEDVLSALKALSDKQFTILYYGPASVASVEKTLDDSYSVASDLKKLEKKHAVKRLTPSTEVFVAHYDARQFNYYQYSDRGETLDLTEVPAVAAFNEYYGGGMNSIVFQEMRESKALAYSAMAGLNSPSWKDDTYSFFAYIASQNDKLQKAVEGFDEIIENMPVAPENLEIAKSSILSKIRTQRVIGAGVLSSYLNAKELGIKEPLDKLIFEKVDGMTMDDMVATHAKWVKDRTYVYGILGDTKDLDMAFLKTLGPVKILSLEDIFGY